MKKGQITIFIVLAIVLVGLILLFILLRTGIIPNNFIERKEINPNTFLENCLEEKIKKTAETISFQGGYISNTLNKTFKFDDDKEAHSISYLCYNQNYYLPCVNQEPMLIQHLKKEIKKEIKNEVENCFNELKITLEEEGFSVSSSYSGFEINLEPKQIILDLNAELNIDKSGEISTQKNFKIIVANDIYDNAIVVQEIVSQEARYCNFDFLGFMILYNEFNIDKYRTSDLSTIYSVEKKQSKEKFRFAIRSCVIPPGF